MKIAIIGAGNVGGALALGWAKAGHEIIIGAKDPNSDKVKKVTVQNNSIKIKSVKEASNEAEVILIAATSSAVNEISKQLGEVKDKVIIDAMNSIAVESAGYPNSFEALKSLTNCENIVKCFNSTGFENMFNPKFGSIAADMFVAGNSLKGKQIATQLAKDIGFAECYDLGGDHRVEMLEQLAMIWVNLAIFQKQGRNIAFKVLKKGL
jgi:8-hydroxy-5-deazaflavin:NADPH oxidoreductase